MNIEESYNVWAEQYDTNYNRTRDLEAKALRETLKDFSFTQCLEIGCGTGKNTEWLEKRASCVTAVDFSEEMLLKAKAKTISEKVEFIRSDINKPWSFTKKKYDLITFSLVLEHVNDLEHIFLQATKLMSDNGFLYIGELHPFKQYMGSKARFEKNQQRYELQCFNHHISDFIEAGKKLSLNTFLLKEFFDNNNDEPKVPRVLVLLLKNRNFDLLYERSSCNNLFK